MNDKNKISINFSRIKKNERILDRVLNQLLTDYDDTFKSLNLYQPQNFDSESDAYNFYILVQKIKRNRNIVSSLVKGFRLLNKLHDYLIIEK